MNLSMIKVPTENASEQDFSSFLTDFKAKLRQLFHQREDLDKLSIERGLPPYLLREVMSRSPFRYFIPADQGGQLTVDIILDHENNVNMVVKDNGIGMSESLPARSPG